MGAIREDLVSLCKQDLTLCLRYTLECLFQNARIVQKSFVCINDVHISRDQDLHTTSAELTRFGFDVVYPHGLTQ